MWAPIRLTCCRTCHTMQVVSLEPEIRWIPQWSVAKQVTISEGGNNNRRYKLTPKSFSMSKKILPSSLHTSPLFFFTHVSNVLSHRLALDQRRDPKAVVPVSAAEEQLSIMGDDKQSCCYIHARSERSRQETLGSGWRWNNSGGGRQRDTYKAVRALVWSDTDTLCILL